MSHRGSMKEKSKIEQALSKNIKGFSCFFRLLILVIYGKM